MQVALGRSESDEVRPGLHKVSKRGDSGLCLTNMLVEEAQMLVLQSHVRSAYVI
ncbi:putative ribosomal protein L10-like domain superfamily [Helianthus debilis subsp. tardiflorus]